MANKKEYTIVINGIKESYEGVKSLAEVLDSLKDTVIKVAKEEEKSAGSKKSATSSTDALAKAQEKLANYDKAYQEELAKVNAELSANKKEISDALKVQQAQQVVDAKQLDTYKDKQTYLTALNTLIRNHSTVTDEDKDAISRMVQESAQLQAELKATDEQMKIYVRNVGNYPGAAEMVVESHKSLKQELKEIKSEMAEMLANGVSKTDEGYLKLAERAGQLKDAMGDASQDIANFASDTRGLSNAINLATSAVNAYQLYNSALQVFGFENENAAESMQKMMAIMTLLNSLQQVQNSLLENGSATARLYSKSVELIKNMLGLKKAAVEADTASTEANSVANEANSATAEANAVANETASAASETNTAVTGANTAAQGTNTAAVGTNTGAVGTNTAALGANTTANQTATTATNSLSIAQKAGAVASKTLSVALRAIPLMFIIGLVISLIQNWESIWNWFRKTFPVLDTISKKFNKFGGVINTVIAVAKGFASAVVNWLINPIKTFANVISKVLSGDFSGAIDAAMTGLKNQFKGTADAFRKSFVAQVNEGQESITRKQAAEEDKRLTHHKNMITKQKNADGTYRKDYIKAEQAMYDNRKKMYKKGSDEYNKVLEEEAAFHQKIEDAKTAATQKGVKARDAAAKKAAADAKKAADEAKKELEEFRKQADEIEKATKKAIEDSDKQIASDRKERLKTQAEELKKAIALSNEEISDATNYLIMFESLKKKAVETAQAYIDNARKLKEAGRDDLAQGELDNAQFWSNLAQSYENYVSFYGKELSHQEMLLAGYTAKRKEIVMNELAFEATELKKNYKEQSEALANQIASEEALLAQYEKRKDEENAKKTKERIDDLKQQLRLATENAKLALGRYFENENIKIPVDFDIDNLLKRYYEVKDKLEKQGVMMPFRFDNITDMLIEPEKAIERFYTRAYNAGATQTEKAENLKRSFGALAQVLNLSSESVEELWKLLEDPKPFLQVKDDISFILANGEVSLSKFGTIAAKTRDEITEIAKFSEDEAKKAYDKTIKEQDSIISLTDKNIKRFQEAAKGIKFEPVMEDDAFTDYFGGQILNIEKTKKRYGELKEALEEYRLSITQGSDEMDKVEEAWQKKLDATARMYGENSTEYDQMYKDYKSSMNSYVVEREKVSQQIEQIEKKEGEVTRDYYESLEKQMKSVYSQLADNVFEPLADGFGALLDFQLEKAQEALEEIEELYDKAVEAREESAARMQEINNELRADDGQNKEALQQRLAEEEVLLVQREETERALEKEKKKREYEVNVAEAKQRKFELGQKLIEGLVNTALGVTAALKYGPILGPIFAAVIGAMGALQTGIIAKQIGQVKMPQKFAKGGRIGEQGFSRSHSQGGHRIEGTNIEVEGQEWVVNKKSSKKYNTLLSAINDDNAVEIKRQVEMLKPSTVNNYVTNNYQNQRQFAGKQIVKYATGGQLNYSEAARTVEESRDTVQLAQLIKQINFQPQVAVTDINRVNKNLTKVRDLARG